MTDRELLEAAAKAAGITGFFRDDLGIVVPELCEHHRFYWNPLTDDGDALRLAVKLRLSISINDRPIGVVRVYVPNDTIVACDEPVGGDTCAATRSAIVRAAAAMTQSPNDQGD